MSQAWIFQGNPDDYDIDGAVKDLDQLWWMTPENLDIQADDKVVIWRAKGGSKVDAGVIATGRVVTAPEEHGIEPKERRYIRNADKFPERAIRAEISIDHVLYIHDSQVKKIHELAEHKIVSKYRVGTVFSLTDDQWFALAAFLPAQSELTD